MIYKNKDITTNIESEKLSINDSNTSFYTEDKGSAALRIFIKYRDGAFNLNDTNLTPTLDLFHNDGSIWRDEPLEIIMSDKGLLQYNIPDNVIAHAGLIKAKLFLKNTEQSVHVANFAFDIKDSGVEGAVAKEINVNLVEDTVRKIMNEDLTELLNSEFKSELTTNLQTYLQDNNDIFKGKDGISPTLPNMENWQKVSLTDSAGNVLFLYEIDFNTIDTLNLTTGFYYVSNGSNLPKNVVNYGYLVYKRLNNNIQRVEYSPYNSTETYIKNKVDTWGEWEVAVMNNEDVKKMKNTIETQSQQISMLQELIMNRGV